MSGDGSVYSRTRTTPDGRKYIRWIAQVSVGRRGERQYVRRVCRTRREATDKLAEMMGSITPVSRTPLGEYLNSWLAETAAPGLAPNTLDGYRAVIAEWGPIATIPLGEVAPEDIERTLNRMQAKRKYQTVAKPASPKTRKNALAMLRTAMESAVKRGHINRNAARLVDMPRQPRRKRPALTVEQAKAILEAVRGDRYEAAYALGLLGLRQGEVLGLQWSDLDLNAGRAELRGQVEWLERGRNRKYRLVQLKTEGSETGVWLPPFVVERLQAHRDAQLVERIGSGVPTEEGLVFVTPSGWPVDGTWLTKHFQGLLEAAKLPVIRFHDLRHGAASLLAYLNVHPSVMQAIMRHSTAKMSLDQYTHVTADMQRQAIAQLQEAIG